MLGIKSHRINTPAKMDTINQHVMELDHLRDADEFRPRAKTMSPNVLRKIRNPCEVTQDSSSSLLIGVLKKSSKESTSNLGGSLPELKQTADRYIEDCLERASRESLTFPRSPLPEGSRTFQNVLVEMGSEESIHQDVDPPSHSAPHSKQPTRRNFCKKRLDDVGDCSNRGCCTPESQLRDVK